jgi:3-deoxy-D-manno-octulosonic-acid transferase
LLPFPRHPLDLIYLGGLIGSSPYWLLKGSARAKVLSALRDRTARGLVTSSTEVGAGPTVLIHAVSLGEINATRTLVEELLKRQPGLNLVVSATTVAGYGRAMELYGNKPRLTVARYPLDFTASVSRFLEHYMPDLVVLMELELWPNFLRLCRRSDIPVVLVNGRLTGHSLRRYKLIGPVARRMFASLSRLCVQDELYRERFLQVGARPQDTLVTGSMKFDTAAIAPSAELTCEIRTSFSLGEQEPVLVAGSTGPGEEELIVGVYRELLKRHPALRLLVVPRKPERFDDVAGLLEGLGCKVIRRSKGIAEARGEGEPAVLLLDTLGELRSAYALGTVVVVGRTLLDLGPAQHGSDMIEPAALGKPVIVGRYTQNFADPMHLLKQHKAIIQIKAEGEPLAGELAQRLDDLLSRPEEARAMGERAVATCRLGVGATGRHAEVILFLLSHRQGPIQED